MYTDSLLLDIQPTIVVCLANLKSDVGTVPGYTALGIE